MNAMDIRQVNKYSLVEGREWVTELTGDPNAEHAADVMRRTASVLDESVDELSEDGSYHSYCTKAINTVIEVRSEVITLVGWKSEAVYLLRNLVEDASALIGEGQFNNPEFDIDDRNYTASCELLMDPDVDPKEMLVGVWGALKARDRIAALVGVADPSEVRHDVIHMLSHFGIKPKTEVAVDRSSRIGGKS